MQELSELKEALNPTEILFVADAMTGQDAVKSAGEFHQRLGITGVILTKMDGDARGGAALSIRTITGQPLKFVGVGEKTDALEAFHPDRVASRILGMGDVLSLIDKVQENIDQETAEKMQEKLLGDDFSLEDFRDQIKQIRKLGSLGGLLEMMPQIGPLKDLKNAKIDESEVGRVVAIIDSMTPKERRHHQIINGSRIHQMEREIHRHAEEELSGLSVFANPAVLFILQLVMKGGAARGKIQNSSPVPLGSYRQSESQPGRSQCQS